MACPSWEYSPQRPCRGSSRRNIFVFQTNLLINRYQGHALLCWPELIIQQDCK